MIDFTDYILFQNPLFPLVVGSFGDWMTQDSNYESQKRDCTTKTDILSPS
jgi:hypothetical protein